MRLGTSVEILRLMSDRKLSGPESVLLQMLKDPLEAAELFASHGALQAAIERLTPAGAAGAAAPALPAAHRERVHGYSLARADVSRAAVRLPPPPPPPPIPSPLALNNSASAGRLQGQLCGGRKDACNLVGK